MSIKADSWIRRMAEERGDDRTLLREPGFRGPHLLWFVFLRLRPAACHGLQNLHSAARNALINPKSIPPEFYRDHQGDHCDIPGNTYALGRTLEYLRIPRDV